MNYITVLKAICVLAFIMDAVLLGRDMSKKLKTEEGKAQWEKEKKFAVYNGIVGFLANFFDTLGIGSFAPTSTAYKFRQSIDDINLPGTLNVGDAFPVLMEAYLFFDFVEVDAMTLVTMLVSCTVGSFVGATLVTKMNRQKIRYAMSIGLFALGIVMGCRTFGVGPFGIVGEATGIYGVKLVISVIIMFFLGAFMNIGCGLYAPSMALVSIMGMNVGAAFPIMMGGSAFLMGIGNTPVFIKESRYDMVATLGNAVLGCLGVIVAYFFVKSLPLTVLLRLVICVVFITSFMMFRDARRESQANA